MYDAPELLMMEALIIALKQLKTETGSQLPSLHFVKGLLIKDYIEEAPVSHPITNFLQKQKNQQ